MHLLTSLLLIPVLGALLIALLPGQQVHLIRAVTFAAGAAYFLGIYRRAFLGQAHNSAVSDAIDLRARELGVIVVMGILILIAGFYPDSVLELTRTASEDWVGTLSGK